VPVNLADLQTQPSAREIAGMAWRNNLKPIEGVCWLTTAGHACSVADAWAAYKRSQGTTDNRPP
jgi:hypothetical protein